MSPTTKSEHDDRPKTSRKGADEIFRSIDNAQSTTQDDNTVPARKAKDIDEVIFQRGCREVLVSELRRQAQVLQSLPKVFVSYSGREDLYFDDARKFLEAKGFCVLHWRSPGRADEYILTDIATRIASCSCFLGIWTGHYSMYRSTASTPKADIPRVWMPLEYGIAVANGAVCQLLIHEDIYPEYINDANLGTYYGAFADKKGLKNLLADAERAFKAALGKRPPRWSQTSPIDRKYLPGA